MVESWEIKNPFPSPYGVRFFRTKYIINNNEIVEFESFRPLTGLGSFELEPEFPELLEPLERFRPLTGLGSFEQSTSGNPIVLIEQKLVSVPLRG